MLGYTDTTPAAIVTFRPSVLFTPPVVPSKPAAFGMPVAVPSGQFHANVTTVPSFIVRLLPVAWSVTPRTVAAELTMATADFMAPSIP